MKLLSILGLGFLAVTAANGQNQPTMPEHAYINPDYAKTLLQKAPVTNKVSNPTQNGLALQKSAVTPIINVQGVIPLLPSDVSSVKSVDIDRDGVDEIVISGSGNGQIGPSISVLKYDATLSKYILSLQKLYPTMYSGNIIGTWTESDGITYALVSDNGLRKINLVTLDTVVHNTSTYSYSNKIAYIDIDGDGAKELVGMNYNSLYIMDTSTLSSTASIHLSQNIIGIGKFDDSSEFQLLTHGYDHTASNNVIGIWQVVNGTVVNVRNIVKALSYNLANVTDLNGDGYDDLIYNYYSYTTYNYILQAEDIKAGGLLWSTSTNNSIDDIVTAKSANTPRLYLRRWGSLDLLDGSTGLVTRTINNVQNNNSRTQLVYGISPTEERVLNFGSNYQGRAFQLINPTNGVITNGLVDHGAPTVFANWIDVDSDGVKELVTIQNNALKDTQSLPKITVFDSTALTVKKSAYLTLNQPNNNGSILDAVLVTPSDNSAPELWTIMYEQNALSLRGVNLSDLSVKRVDINSGYANERRLLRATDATTESRIVIIGESSALLFDTATQTILSELNFGNSYLSNGIHISRSKNDLGQTVIYLSGQQPNSSANAQIGVITIVGDTLSLTNPITRFAQSIGKVTASPDSDHQYLYAMNHDGELYRYHLASKKWEFFTKACTYGSDAVLKPVDINELMLFCGDAGAVIDLTQGNIRWATSKLGFNVANSRAISLLNSGNDKKLVVGGARIAIASYSGDVKTPIAAPLSMSMHWNKTATIQLPVVNPNPDRNFNTSIVLNPGNGTLTVENSATATVKYTPGEASLEPVTAMYLVKNDYIESAPATINITKTNTKPVAYGTTITVRASKMVSGKLNGNDPDNDPVTWQMQTQPTKGNVTLSADGSFSFTANAGVTGSDTFAAVLKDAVSVSEPVQVVVNIEAEPKKSKGGSVPGVLFMLMLVAVVGRQYLVRK